MRNFLLKAACFVVSAIPWAAFVALCVAFGPFEVLVWLAMALLAVIFAIVAILVIRGCTLELYERLHREENATMGRR